MNGNLCFSVGLQFCFQQVRRTKNRHSILVLFVQFLFLTNSEKPHLKCHNSRYVHICQRSHIQNNVLFRRYQNCINSISISVTIYKMQTTRNSNNGIVYILLLSTILLLGIDNAFISSTCGCRLERRIEIKRNTNDEQTPQINPASVPMVIVKMQHTIKHQKSAHDVFQRGTSSENCLNSDIKLTKTIAAREALGMNLITSVRKYKQRIISNGEMIL